MELIKNYIMFQSRITLSLAVFILLMAVIMTIAHHKIVKKNNDFKIWRLFCGVPLILCIFHFIFFHFKGLEEVTVYLYSSIYLSGIFMAVWQFLYKRKNGYRIFAAVMNIMAVISLMATIIIPLSIAPSIRNYTDKSYCSAFKSVVKTMKRDYVLSDWKDIDYDKLEKKILPLVEKAEKEKDKTAYYTALVTYCYYFYDSHVVAMPANDSREKYYNEAKKLLAGNDYGLSMYTLDNGDTIAILVEAESEAEKNGIHNGTIITKWNGKSIKEAKSSIECIYPELAFPVKENEEYIKTFFLAGKGDDKVKITFLNEEGNEQTVSVSKIGDYSERLDMALNKFYHNNEEDDKNFHFKMLTDECGYIKISEEAYDMLSDTKATVTGNHPEVMNMLDKKLKKMSEKGMEKLIIDIRNNEGGSNAISNAIVSLFTDKKLFGYGMGKYKNGIYYMNDYNYIKGNGKWSDIDMVVLVNSQCCSAGDYLAYNFSKMDNVTVMGITTSNGVNQSAGGMCITTDGDFAVLYPIGLMLDENGFPLIDTRTDRQTNINLDEKIKVDYEAAEVMFGENDRDYELEYAVDFLEKSK